MSPAESDAGATGVPAYPGQVEGSTEQSTPETELAPRFRDRLRVFAAHRLGDASAAEDVAQETLRRVAEALRAGRLEQPAALPAFVFQTARHVCMQLRRSAARESRAFARLSSGDRSEADSADICDPLTALITQEQRVAVRQALQALDHEDRELLRLAYFDQLSANEIAAQLSSTPGAVRVRKHRALRRLADCFEKRPGSNTTSTLGT